MAGDVGLCDMEQSDFNLTLEDNCRISFLVRGLTKSSGPVVKGLLHYMRSLPPFQAPSSFKGTSSKDILRLRFLPDLPHCLLQDSKGTPSLTCGGSKRLFGYFGVAFCHDPDDFIEAESNYRKEIQRVSHHLITNKCLVFGDNEELKSSLKGHDSFVLVPFKKHDQLSSCSQKLLEILSHSVVLVHTNLTVSIATKQLLKKAGSLDHQNESGILTEEQQRHQEARSLKVKADLFLLLGRYTSANGAYREALGLLRQLKDHYWAGLSLEGVLSSRLLSSIQCTNLLSLTESGYHISNKDTTINNNTTDDGTVPAPTDDVTDVSTISDYADSIDGHSSSSSDSIDKDFQTLLNYYDKTVPTGRLLYIEVSLKYSSYLIQIKSYSKACHFMEDITGIDIPDTQLKFSLYLSLSLLYHKMGFERKTMFMIVSAARTAAKINSNNDELKIKAYNLLQYCISQFHTATDDEQCPQVSTGWPLLQSTIIREYTYCCTELGYKELFFEWSWLLLQKFFSYLSSADVDKIKTCVKEMTGGDTLISAPFSLTSIPRITQLKPQPLAQLLRVKKSLTLFPSLLSKSDSSEGPFLLSMIGRKTVKKTQKQEVLWVQGDPAEVLMIVSNPLPTEIKVEKMTILLEGGSVVTYPSNISLPAKCESQEFVLLCIPQEACTLSIAGYTACILGLSNRSSSTQTDSIIKVIPSLPQLRVRAFPQDEGTTPINKRNSTTSLGSTGKRRSITNLNNFELLDGEHYECVLQFQSIGDVPIDCIKMTLEEQNVEYCSFSWDDDKFTTLFPLTEKNKTYHFPVKISTSFPSYLRVGSCKVLHHRSRINSLFSPTHKPDPVSNKSKTLNVPRPTSVTSSGGSVSERSSNTSSLLSSPIRLMRREGSLRRDGSLRRSAQKKKEIKSELLESLDLQQRGSSLPPHLPPVAPPIHKGGGSNEGLKEGGVAGGGVEGKDQLKKRFDFTHRSPSLIRRNKKPDPKTNSKNLMDSLNLETQKVSPQIDHTSRYVSHTPKEAVDHTPNPLVEDQWSVRSDVDVDFDGSIGDRTSIKSDPGIDILPVPFTGGPSSLSNSPRGVSTTPSGPSSFKLATLMKKRPAGPQASLPVGASTAKVVQTTRGPVMPFISHPTKAEKLRHRPGKKSVKTVFMMKYSGGEGAKEGYYREVTLELSSVVKPTLIFDEFVVTSTKGQPDLFNFGMVMENVSPYALDITINIKQDDLSPNTYIYTLDADRNDTISLPMKRFTLPERDTSIKEANVIKHYCEHLINLLEIKWTSRGRIIKNGVLLLTGLQLPQSVLSIIRPLPILFDVRMEAPAYSPGVPVSIGIKVTNNTSGALPSSLITLSPFFLSPKGQKVNCTKKHYLINSQSLTHWIPKIDHDGSYSFSLHIVFLYSKEYLIDIVHHITELPKDTDNATKDISTDKISSVEIDNERTISKETFIEQQKQMPPPQVAVVSSLAPVMSTNPPPDTALVDPSTLTDSLCNTQSSTQRHWSNTNRTKAFIENCRSYIGPQLTITIN